MAVVVEYNQPEDRILVVKFLYRRPETGRKVSKTLRFNQSLVSPESGKLVGNDVITAYIDQMISRKVFTPAFLDNTPCAPMKAQILRNLRSGPTRHSLVAKAKAEAAEEDGESEKTALKAIRGGGPPWGRLFAPAKTSDGETGKSNLIVGSSFSGKTHLFVTELNRLDPGEYDGIVLMTESRFAPPLKRINPALNVVILEGFDPETVDELKEINDITGNRYRWLIILDDIVDQKHSKTLSKMLLTYRNANITTVLAVQYPGLVNKSTRGSLHSIVITGFRSLEDWEAISRVFDLLEWAKDRMEAEDIEVVRSKIRKSDAFRWLKEKTSEPGHVLYLDQKHSKDPVLAESSG